MTDYSYQKEMLTEAYLHSVSEVEKDVQESRKYSILSILAILLKMICGKRVLKINEENEDIEVSKQETLPYWYVLTDQSKSSITHIVEEEENMKQVERLLENQSLMIF